MLELALLAIPAGIVGFIAAPCCGLLAPAYLPFVMRANDPTPTATPPSATPAAHATPTVRELPLIGASAIATRDTTLRTEAVRLSGRRAALLGFVAFAVGFCLFFTLLGVSASALGALLLDRLSVLEKIAGIFILAVGVAMLTRFRIFLPRTDKCMDSRRLRRGVVGPFTMGFAIAVTWTPCTGSTLGAILAMATLTDTVWQGGVLLFLYSLGLTVPFGLMALALGKAQRLQRFQSRHEAALERIAGVVMITVAALVLLGGWQRWLGPFTAWLNSHGWPPL